MPPRGRGQRPAPARRGGATPRLTADDIQSVLDAAVPLGDGVSASLATASGGAASGAAFDDALHAVVTTGRPTTREECEVFVARVAALIRAAGASAENWKALVLALVRRRYHSRAPAAVTTTPSGEGGEEGESAEEVAGDGERLLFYLAVHTLQAASQEGHPHASQAAQVLCRLAPLAGGTRDVCALMEHLGFQAVSDARRSGRVQPLGDRVLPALIDALPAFLDQGDGSPMSASYAALFSLVASAAEMLDHDLTIVRQDAAAASKAEGRPTGEDSAAGGPPTSCY